MKTYIIFLLIGLLLILHGTVSLGDITAQNHLPVNKLRFLLTIIEISVGGWLFFLYKKSKQKQVLPRPQNSTKSHINIFGLVFGFVTLSYGTYGLYLNVHSNKGSLWVALCSFILGFLLLLATYIQRKGTSRAELIK